MFRIKILHPSSRFKYHLKKEAVHSSETSKDSNTIRSHTDNLKP
jgi:hypothetical protein